MPKSADKIPKKKASSSTSGGGGKKKTSTCSAKQLLGVIAEIGLLHGGKAPRDLVAKRAGYGNAENGSFKKAISRATQRGFVDASTDDKTVLELTALGNQEAGDPPKLETNEEAHAKIKEQLTKKMIEAFEYLEDGKPHLRSDIATHLGYNSVKEQGFKKLLDRIKAKGFLDYIDKETIQLSDICFPNGRN